MVSGASPQRRGSIHTENFGDSYCIGCAQENANGRVTVVKRSRFSPLVLVSLGMALAVLFGAVVVGPAGADAISDKRAEAARIGARLAQLEERQLEVNGLYEQASFELSQAQERVGAAKALAAQTATEAEKRLQDLRRYAVAAYQTGNDSPEFDALISNDAGTGVQKRSYLKSISGSRQDLVDALNAARQKAEEDGVRLRVAEGVAASKSAEIEELKKAADDARNEVASISTKVNGELKILVDAENARIAAIAAAQRAAAEAARRGSMSAPNPNAPRVGQGAAGAIAAGMTRLGATYEWAASGPTVFDCSGFVMWAYQQVGVSIGRSSGNMWAQTVRISEEQLQPGDLVFWGAQGSQHVAIYIGGNQILHTARGVAVTSMNGWWIYGPIMTFGRIP